MIKPAKLSRQHVGGFGNWGNAARRVQFSPLLMDVSHVSPCHVYRDQAEGETDTQYVDRLIAELEAEIGRVRPLGDALHAALMELSGQHPHGGDIRGEALFRAIELVQSRDAKEPFDSGEKGHSRVKSAAFDAVLICYPMGARSMARREITCHWLLHSNVMTVRLSWSRTNPFSKAVNSAVGGS